MNKVGEEYFHPLDFGNRAMPSSPIVPKEKVDKLKNKIQKNLPNQNTTNQSESDPDEELVEDEDKKAAEMLPLMAL